MADSDKNSKAAPSKWRHTILQNHSRSNRWGINQGPVGNLATTLTGMEDLVLFQTQLVSLGASYQSDHRF